MCVYMYLLVVLPGGDEEQVPGERYKPPTHFYLLYETEAFICGGKGNTQRCP